MWFPMIDIHCPLDGTVYHAEESHIGRSIRCQKCGAILKIEHQVAVPITKREQRPIDRKKETVPSAKPLRSQPIWPVKSDRMSRESEILIGLGIAAFGILLFVVLWRMGSSRIANRTPASGSDQYAKDHSPEPFTPSPEVKPIQPLTPWPKINPIRSIPTLKMDPIRSAPIEPIPPEELALPSQLVPPCAEGQEPERLPTGTRIEPDNGVSGRCTLKISNGTGHDAAVRLAESATGRTARFVYIETGRDYTLSGIEPGVYSLRFETGLDWIPICKGFLRDEDIQEFDESLEFRSITNEDKYSIRTLTTHARVSLNPVVGGNAKTHHIDREHFFEGDQHVTLGP